mgnify:CR=1 FL=1
MSGRPERHDDTWPIDDLFNQLFQSGDRKHPLRHMAWCDWCCQDEVKNHQLFLDGGSLPRTDPEEVCNAIQESLVWRYLYPTPLVLRDLVSYLTKMLALFGEDWETPSSDINKIGYFQDKDRLRDIVKEFSKQGKLTFLEQVWESLPFSTMLTNNPGRQQGDGKPPVPKTLKELDETLDLFAWGMKQTDLYDEESAAKLLGSPEKGWSPTSTVAILMGPLNCLFEDAARLDKFQLGSRGQVTSLGQMAAHIGSFTLGQGQRLKPRQFGAAHFCFNPITNPPRDFLRREQMSSQDLNKSGFYESHPELHPKAGAPVNPEWKRLFALSGYNTGRYLMPAVRALGQAYGEKKVGVSWLWRRLESHPIDPVKNFRFDDLGSPQIFRRVWDLIGKSVQTPLTTQAGTGATAPTAPANRTPSADELRQKEFAAPAVRSPRKRRRSEDESGVFADVGQFAKWPGEWRPSDAKLQETGERLVPASDKDNTLLYVGGAALLALLVMAR